MDYSGNSSLAPVAPTLATLLVIFVIFCIMALFTTHEMEIDTEDNTKSEILDYREIIRYTEILQNLLGELDTGTNYNCYIIQREELMIVEVTIFGDRNNRFKRYFDKDFPLEEFKVDPDKVLSEAAIMAVVLGA